MELSDSDLVAFRSRCLMAAERGYTIARAEEYMEAMEAEVGGMIAPPDGAEVASAAHLAMLAEAVMAAREGGPKKIKKDPKPAVKTPEPKVEPVKVPEPVKAPEPKPEPAPEPAKMVEPVKVVEPPPAPEQAPAVETAPPVKVESAEPVVVKEEEVPPYETWTKDALVEEAHARKIQTTSRMTKAEVIELLEADDAKAEAK